MQNLAKMRNNQILIAILVLMVVLVGRLFYLTVIDGKVWTEKAEKLSVREIHTTAPRGDIYDRNNKLIATSVPQYNVHVTKNKLSETEMNLLSRNLNKLFQENGDTIIDEFPIKYEEGKFLYTYDQKIQEYLAAQNMSPNLTGQQAFDELRLRYNIDPSLDQYEAQLKLQNVHAVFPPISVGKTIEFISNNEKKSFLERYQLKPNVSAETAFNKIVEHFEVNEGYSVEEKRQILIIRDSVDAQGFKQYIPVEVANSVSDKTVIAISEGKVKYNGAQVVLESKRVYPYGTVASHVIGYLGKISEANEEKYVNELNYSRGDLIGLEGMEKYYESTLKGTDGVKKLEVDVHGNLVREISEIAPKKGKDIKLTIDIDLQKLAEDSLTKTLEQLRVEGTFESKWGNFGFDDAYPRAEVGSVVALDPKTGEVLVLANSQNFDPNDFSSGITSENWDKLQPKNPRDPMSPRPLYNVATNTSVQPGSTFKPVVGAAALDQGWDPNRSLYDDGKILLGGNSFGCWIWNLFQGKHGYENFYEALEESCNYYFFDLGTGHDWYTGKDLPIKMGSTVVMETAKKFGLGQKTGIELSETIADIPSEANKLKHTKINLESFLRRTMAVYFGSEVAEDEKKSQKIVDEVTSWVDTNPKREVVYEGLEKLGVDPNKTNELTDIVKYDYAVSGKWNTGDMFNLSIGQGENSYTPLQMGRYVSTIANDGIINPVTLTKAVDGKEKVYDKGKASGVKPSSIADIQEGMRRVATGSDGSARATFTNFPIQVAAKSGTAERSGKINPPDEVAYIKQYLPSIYPSLSFEDLMKKTNALMTESPDIYKTQDVAIRVALMELSKGKVTADMIDAFKPTYENFGVFMGYAPYDDPQIAISVLLVQGGTGAQGGPLAREIMAEYLGLNKTPEAENK